MRNFIYVMLYLMLKVFSLPSEVSSLLLPFFFYYFYIYRGLNFNPLTKEMSSLFRFEV